MHRIIIEISPRMVFWFMLCEMEIKVRAACIQKMTILYIFYAAFVQLSNADDAALTVVY